MSILLDRFFFLSIILREMGFRFLFYCAMTRDSRKACGYHGCLSFFLQRIADMFSDRLDVPAKQFSKLLCRKPFVHNYLHQSNDCLQLLHHPIGVRIASVLIFQILVIGLIQQTRRRDEQCSSAHRAAMYVP